MPTDGEHDVATGAGQFVGQLHAGGRRTDDEDAAVGQVGGTAVRFGVNCCTEAGSCRATAGTRGRSHHPVARTTLRACQVAADSAHDEAVGRRPHGVHRAVVLDRRIERVGIGGEVIGDLGGGHEPVVVGTAV